MEMLDALVRKSWSALIERYDLVPIDQGHHLARLVVTRCSILSFCSHPSDVGRWPDVACKLDLRRSPSEWQSFAIDELLHERAGKNAAGSQTAPEPGEDERCETLRALALRFEQTGLDILEGANSWIPEYQRVVGHPTRVAAMNTGELEGFAALSQR